MLIVTLEFIIIILCLITLWCAYLFILSVIEKTEYTVTLLCISMALILSTVGLYAALKFGMYKNYYNHNSKNNDLKLEYVVNSSAKKNYSNDDLNLLYNLITTIEHTKFYSEEYDVYFSDIETNIIDEEDQITIEYSYTETVTKFDLLGIKKSSRKSAQTTIKKEEIVNVKPEDEDYSLQKDDQKE